MHFFLGNRKLVKADEESAAEGLEGLAKAVDSGMSADDIKKQIEGTAYSLAELKAISPTLGQCVYLSLAGRSGVFTAALASEYAAEIVADTQGGIYIPSDVGAYVWIRRFKDTAYVTWWGALGVGSSNDDTLAFSEAFASPAKNIVCPITTNDGYYYVGNVTLPKNKNLIGHTSVRVYNPYTSPDDDVVGLGAIVYNTDYSDCLTFAGYNKVQDIILHGNNKTLNGVSNALSAVHSLFFDRVSMTNYAYAYGSTNTINNSRFVNCHAGRSDIGFRNLVDSHVISAEVNSNRVGIDSQSGANDTSYLGCKVEWSTEENWRFNSSANNTVVGGVCDRAGESGFRITSADVQISNVKTRRNGASNLGDVECTHYYIEGDCNVTITNIQTSVGSNDDGSGDTTPSYSVSCAGSQAEKVVIVGGDATGCVTSPYHELTTPEAVIISDVLGVDDITNHGRFQKGDARAYNQFASFGNVSDAASSTVSLEDVSMGTYSRQYRELIVYARNASTGGQIAGKIPVIRRREAGDASVVIYDAIFESSTGAVGGDSTDDIQIAIDNIATDFSTYDITVTNNSGYTLGIKIEVI